MNTVIDPVRGQAAYRVAHILRGVQASKLWPVLAGLTFLIWLYFLYRHNNLPPHRRVECEQIGFFELLLSVPHADCADLSWSLLFALLFILLSFRVPQLLFSALANRALSLSANAGNDDANMELGLSLCGRSSRPTTGEGAIHLPAHEPTKDSSGNDSAWSRVKNFIANWYASISQQLRRQRCSKATNHFLAIPPVSRHWNDAQFALGRLNIIGAIPVDTSKAIAHFTHAADAGHRMAALELGQLVMTHDPEQARQRLEWGLSDDQVSDGELAQKATLALAWLCFTDKSKDRSMTLVREILEFDEGSITSIQKNTEWFSREFITSGRLRTGAQVVRTLIEQDERAEQRENARKELFSFITHSIPSAMSTVVAETEQSLDIVQSAFTGSKAVRDHLIKSLSSTLARAGLIDSLMATHKLLIAGKESLQLAWASETLDCESPLLVVIDAIKQAVAQTLFADEAYEQIDLDRSDHDQINRMRELSLGHLTSATTKDSLEDFLRFVSCELPFLSIECTPDLAWRVARGGIRYSVLVSIISELMRNTLRYREYRTPVIVRVHDHDAAISVTLENTITRDGSRRSSGTNRGLAFIREFSAAIGKFTFTSCATESTYTATLCVST